MIKNKTKLIIDLPSFEKENIKEISSQLGCTISFFVRSSMNKIIKLINYHGIDNFIIIFDKHLLQKDMFKNKKHDK